ncbi:MAG: hypothetical protein ACI837_000210 [Crocinitomicaceae bacterium]|jgi:hypothetical protein
MEMKQTTNTVLMIAPTRFGFNEEAFLTNSFQNRPEESEHEVIQQEARMEFDRFVDQLQELDVHVLVFEDHPFSKTPDSIFPNNWISLHQTGELITYPMAVSSRRGERREDIVDYLIEEYGYAPHNLSASENMNPPAYLEGTGSMIFDHQNKLIYAAISPRTSWQVLKKVEKTIGYTTIPFQSFGKAGELIYHTNVMMCVGDSYVIIGPDTLDPLDRDEVLDLIQESGKTRIDLTNDQVYHHFAGNMLQVENKKGETILVLSESAEKSLTGEQKKQLGSLNDHLLIASIPTIERIGGGSVRCMLTEVFSPT